MSRKLWGMALALALVLLANHATAADKLIFGNPNPAGLNIGMGPFFYAMEMGFFADEGIELEFVNFNGGAVLDPQIANRSVDIGWSGPDSLVVSNDEGKSPLPYRYFYNHLRAGVWEIVVPAASPIKTIKDLKGGKLGVNSLTTTNIPTTKAILRDAGLDFDKDVTWMAVGMGPPAFQAIRGNQIDALNLFDTMHAILENTGFAIRRLDIPKRYQLFDNGFTAHVDTIKEKRKQLVGFARAISKATVGCYANLEACVKITWKQSPALKPKEGDDAKHLMNAVNIMKTRGVSYWAFDGSPRGKWGSFTDEMWKLRVDALHETGVIKADKIDPAKLYTNDLIKDINAFDWDVVEKQAKSLK